LDPTNPDILYSNANPLLKSIDGGKTWKRMTVPHGDNHDIWINPDNPDILYWLYAGQQDNYSTIAVPSFPPSAIQNPGTGWIINTGGCETGPAVPKPGNHNIVYANCKGRFGVFNKITGVEKSYYVGASNIYGHNPKDLKYRFQRVAPVHVSPHLRLISK